MAWSDAARAAAAEARRRKGVLNKPIDVLRRNKKGGYDMKQVPASDRFKKQVMALAALRNHPNYSASDMKALSAKGYTPKEIKEIWDRDNARNGPGGADRTKSDRVIKAMSRSTSGLGKMMAARKY